MVANYRPWTLMFAGAAACVVLCVGLVYLVTVTGDTSYEFIIYVLVLLGFMLLWGVEYRLSLQRVTTRWFWQLRSVATAVVTLCLLAPMISV